jgi:hypothetical protein
MKEEKKTSGKKGDKKVSNIEYWEQRLMMCEHMPDQMKALNGWTDEEIAEEIVFLSQKIKFSKQGKSSRTKGATYENKVRDRFLDKWGVRLVRTPMSGGFQKSADNDSFRGDLSCLDKDVDFRLSPECKKQQTWNLRKWFDQAKDDAPKGKIPIVIYHDFQQIKNNKVVRKADDFVMLRLEDFLDIVDQSKVVLKKKPEGIKRDVSGSRGNRKGIKRIKPSRS